MTNQNRNLYFSWLKDNKLAGLAWPGTKKDIEFLYAEGIRWLVSLTERPPSLHGVSGIKLIHIPVPDLQPPTVEQIQQFIKITEEAHKMDEAVAVHCQYGRGRTGTMLACYVVRTTKCNAVAAVEKVRKIRPGSIETSEQEEAIEKYVLTQLKPTT